MVIILNIQHLLIGLVKVIWVNPVSAYMKRLFIVVKIIERVQKVIAVEAVSILL